MLRIAMVAGGTALRPATRTPRTPHLGALSEALADAGHEITAITRGTDAENRRGEVPGRRFRVFGSGRDVLPAVVSCRPDVVHAHGWDAGSAAEDAARRLDVPFVFSVPSRGDASSSDRDRAARRRVLLAADQVVVTFTGQVAALRSAGVPRHRISVVPHGVDADHFVPEGDRAPRRYPRRVIALGEVTPSSGFGTVVAALPALPDTELLLVGGPGRGTHAKELRAYARSLGVGDRVHLAGPAGRDELPALLRSSDLMVCSPWEASFGVSAVEAMACGVAVVANGTGGLADTVIDEVTGIHVPPRRPRALASALRRALNHPVLLEQHGAVGRDRASTRYRWPRVAGEMVHAYRRAGAADPAVLAREAAAAARKTGSRTTATQLTLVTTS